MLREKIVNRIIEIRKEKGMSQEKLSSLCGLDRTYISGVERKTRNLTLDSLEKILSGLKIKPSDFFHSIKYDK